MTDKKLRIEYCSIAEDLKLKAIEFTQARLDKQQKMPEVAFQLKRHFDEHFHPHWQCVVGKEFGSDIGFEGKHVIYFFVGRVAILLWKAG